MKTVIVGNTNGLKRGKTAIATSLTAMDQFQPLDSNQWHSADEAEHGTPVKAVNHFGRHVTEQGDILLVESIKKDTPARVEVLEIRAVDVDQLMEEDFQALGYTGRDDYMLDWGHIMGNRVWLIRIKHLGFLGN